MFANYNCFSDFKVSFWLFFMCTLKKYDTNDDNDKNGQLYASTNKTKTSEFFSLYVFSMNINVCMYDLWKINCYQ